MANAEKDRHEQGEEDGLVVATHPKMSLGKNREEKQREPASAVESEDSRALTGPKLIGQIEKERSSDGYEKVRDEYDRSLVRKEGT